MDMSHYKSLFISESREHLRALNELIVGLEKDGGDRDKIDSLFRMAHSIKGMAASMGYSEIAELAHRMEDLMDRVRKGVLSFAAGEADILLEGADLLELMIQDVENDLPDKRDISGLIKRLGEHAAGESPGAVSSPPQTEVQPASPLPSSNQTEPPRSKEEGELQPSVRVRTAVLDSLMNTTGELITNRQRLLEICREVGSERLDGAVGELSRLLRELHNEVLSARMMPFAAIADRFPRLMRDLAKQGGKELVFECSGKEIELDRGILEGLFEPLVHMLRNAVDHGLERAADRLALGKRPAGTVRLSARRHRDRLLIVVEDDGRGIDPARLIASAIDKGIIGADEGSSMSPKDAFMLICAPGFSTAETVTGVSGRGVGMDAVRSGVHALGGSLAIESEVGKGSRIILKLPLSIAIIHVLLVTAAHLTVAIPVVNVLRTMDLRHGQITSRGRERIFYLEEEAVPLVSLSRLCGVPFTPPSGEFISVFVTEMGGRKVGVVVDRLLGQQEVFVKPLGRPLGRLRGLGGGAVLGDGEAVFILDLANLP